MEREKGFELLAHEHDKRVVAAYLKYGSVDEILKRQYELKIHLSQSGIHRLLKKWGVIKAAGPNNKLNEAFYFLEQLADEKIPLERLYKRMPPSFQTSAVTLHRILSHIKSGVTRRAATALVITQNNDPNKILIGRDISTPRLEYGKFYGAFSLPMGFSKKKEHNSESVMRVLQQEVFSQQVIERNFPEMDLINIRPISHFDVIDIRLSVYHLVISDGLGGQVNSFKLTDYDFKSVDEIFEEKRLYRAGVPELCGMYGKLRCDVIVNAEVPVITSELNLALLND